ncbi:MULTISPECIES: hypothetical protein [Streptomyces]|uniref:hypothetical protein n=1 Tax=Streptomyces TaxID=1883 RepID=UPI000B2E60D8|nr:MULTISPECIES: hypothetical protein [Streptomyces]
MRLIARYCGGTNIESECYDADGRSLTLDEVIEDFAHLASYEEFLTVFGQPDQHRAIS